MSPTATTNAYRMEVRLGRAGWRWHLRGPAGIEGSAPIALATREEARDDGRAFLSASGLESWDEWMDGVTDNRYDPRADRVPTVDAVKEAQAAGLTAPSKNDIDKATKAIRELEAKREKAAEDARKARLHAPPDEGMGLDGGPKGESPLGAQKKRASRLKDGA